MNFIGAVLRTVDGFWALLTLPALLFGGAFFINMLPIPTLIVLLGLAYHQQMFGDTLRQLGCLAENPAEYEKMANAKYRAAALMVICIVAAYVFFIIRAMSDNGLCTDTSDMIPLTLVGILQFFVQSNC